MRSFHPLLIAPTMPLMAMLLMVMLMVTSRMAVAQGEIYSFSHLDINDGLSHNQVNTILKDKNGFVWFGTMSGLNRYDSYHFEVHRSRPEDSTSLSDNYISALFELPDDKIWVATRGGFN